MTTLLLLLRRGLGRAVCHPGLVLLCYLVSLVPALGPVLVFSLATGATLDRSLMSDRILAGDWQPVLIDLTASRGGEHPVPPLLVLAMVVVTIVLQVLLAAVVVELLRDRQPGDPGPSLAGIGRSCRRFWRSWLWFVLALAAMVLVAVSVVVVLTGIAEEQADARFDLVGLAIAAGLLLLGFVPLDLAYDLSRIAAARHDDGATLRGLWRALVTVLRRPLLLLPLYGTLAVLPVLLHLAFRWLHRPSTPGGGRLILILLLLQQLVMLVRALHKLWFWGAELELYRLLGEPRWCQRRSEPPMVSPAQSRPPTVRFQEG